MGESGTQPIPGPPRTTRISAIVLGTIGAVMGGAAALASVFAPDAPDFTPVPASLAAGALALAFSALGELGAAETTAHPHLAGVLMLVAAGGGYAAIGADIGIAPVLLAAAGVLALTVPPVRPHRHRLPVLLRPSGG